MASTVELVKTHEDDTTEYKLTGGGIEVIIYSLGGIIQSIKAPNKDGAYADVTLGYDTPQEYGPFFFGALIGRFANRISEGKFTLDGTEYQLAVNKSPNHLHGGVSGYDKKYWNHSIEDNKLVLTYTSVDGEENYPGTLEVKVTYEVTADGEIVIDYTASTDKPTILNLTNHTYFNLAGQETGNIHTHKVELASTEYTPKDEVSIPTGEIASVEGTNFDLRDGRILDMDTLAAINGQGYDHNFLVPGEQGTKRFVGKVTAGGRVMEVYTTQPGVQFYTGCNVNCDKGKGGVSYGKFSGLCLETQHYPNSPNQPNFPSCVLRPEETYHHTTWYKFSAE